VKNLLQRRGTMSRPTIGEFKNGRDEFFDQETLNGRAILVRFVISDITPNSCRIIEMRTYKTRPGRRSEFFEIFHSKSIPAQKEIGMKTMRTSTTSATNTLQSVEARKPRL
jgi:hypothetical protein